MSGARSDRGGSTSARQPLCPVRRAPAGQITRAGYPRPRLPQCLVNMAGAALPQTDHLIWQPPRGLAAPAAWGGPYGMLLWSDTVRALGTATRCCGSSADTADTRDLSLVSGGCHVR